MNIERGARWPWHGRIVIRVRRLGGREEVLELTNTITTVGRNLLRDALRGALSDVEVKYMALGTDSTAPGVGQTQLGAETFRKVITTAAAGATGESVLTCYLAPYDCVGTVIAELGWFAGADATSTPNSGVMVARVLYSPSHTKTNLESIQIDRHDTLG